MIPRTIHAIWLGGDLPAYARRFLDGWQRLNPGWDVRLWTAVEEVGLRNQNLAEKAAACVPPQSVPQFLSDLMRYEILERYGGVYVDCDMECRRPLEGLLHGRECFAGWEVEKKWVGNAILGAAPGALFLQRLIDALPWSVECNRGKRPNVSTGPQFVTAQYQGHTDELHVFPQSHFYPAKWSEFERSTEEWPDAFSVHHWANARRQTGASL